MVEYASCDPHSLTLTYSQRTDAILVLFISTCTLFSFFEVSLSQGSPESCRFTIYSRFILPISAAFSAASIFHGHHRKLSQFLSHASSQDENIRGGPENWGAVITVGDRKSIGCFVLVGSCFSNICFSLDVFFHTLFRKGTGAVSFRGPDPSDLLQDDDERFKLAVRDMTKDLVGASKSMNFSGDTNSGFSFHSTFSHPFSRNFTTSKQFFSSRSQVESSLSCKFH